MTNELCLQTTVILIPEHIPFTQTCFWQSGEPRLWLNLTWISYKFRWDPNYIFRFLARCYVGSRGLVFSQNICFYTSFSLKTKTRFLMLKWFYSEVHVNWVLSALLFVAAPAVSLHQLLVWCFLSGHGGKLWLRSLPCQQHGLPGNQKTHSVSLFTAKILVIFSF